MASTDLYENFRSKTTVCEHIAGTAQERTDTTLCNRAETSECSKKLTAERVCHCQALLANTSAAQRKLKPANVSDVCPFKGPEGALAPYSYYLEVDSDNAG